MYFFGIGGFFRIIKSVWYAIIYTLVRALSIMMGFNAAQDMPKMFFSQRDDLVQRLPGFPDKPFGIGITHGCLRWGFYDFNAIGFNNVIQRYKT